MVKGGIVCDIAFQSLAPLAGQKIPLQFEGRRRNRAEGEIALSGGRRKSRQGTKASVVDGI